MRADPSQGGREDAGCGAALRSQGCLPADGIPPPPKQPDDNPTIQELYARLVEDSTRNELIFDDILTALEAGRSPVVITERKDHVTILADLLSKFARNVIVLRGGMGARQLRATAQSLAAVPDNEERLLVATGRYLGEGFDDARLDTLFLTLPISWRGTLAQYAGRLHRLHATKREVTIYDYVDASEPMLMKMAAKREVGYRSLGYHVVDDAQVGLHEPCKGPDPQQSFPLRLGL